VLYKRATRVRRRSGQGSRGRYQDFAVGGHVFAAHLNNISSNPSEEVFYVGADQTVYEIWAWSVPSSFDGWHNTDISVISGGPSAPLTSGVAPAINNVFTPVQDEGAYIDANGHVHVIDFVSPIWTPQDVTALAH